MKNNKVIITQNILNYIKSKFTFDLIPEEGSIWEIKKITSYPNVYGGFPIVELENKKGEWLRIPKSLLNN